MLGIFYACDGSARPQAAAPRPAAVRVLASYAEAYNSNQFRIVRLDAIVSDGWFLAEDVTLSSGNNLILADGGVVSESISLNLDTSNKKTFTYDANGSLTQVKFRDKTITYTYDYENRLTAVSGQPSAISYKYDYLGRRIQKTVGATVTNYIYDGDNIIAEYDGSGTLTAKYVYGPNIDEPIRLERGGQICYYHFDALGSITDLSNSSGLHIEHYYYDPFGNTRIYDPATGLKRAASSYSNFYMFTGRQWDGESGLYYYRARYYDVSLGRFLQADPVGYEGGYLNLYSYCGNNSINHRDPFGLEELDIYSYRGGGRSGGVPSSGGGWGHAWGDVTDSSGKREGFGFYPARAARREAILGSKYGKAFQDDTAKGHSYSGHHKWDLTPTQYKNVKNFIQNFMQNGPEWTMGRPWQRSNNCADFVVGMLDAAGIEHPDFRRWGKTDPDKIEEWLNKLEEEFKRCGR